MRAALAILLAGTAAAASPAPVVGGSNAPQGKWPDAAAVLYRFNGQDGQECSGVLVASNVVLTAGHCANAALGTLDNVLLGTASLASPDDGEIIGVKNVFPYPDADTTIDVAAILLARGASETPRALATGWARLDVVNGAAVEIVGWGAVDTSGNSYVNNLQQAQTTITDVDCSTNPDCHVAARPAGELAAGGMGVDSCAGDSGGPLYLVAGYGNYLVGVTSRGYTGSTTLCGGGGIYSRPDKIIDWIESTTGAKVARGPEPHFGTIHAKPGAAGETTLAANDPRSKTHDFTITTPPAQGTAAIRASDGRVRVCVDPAAAAGTDSMEVAITDTNDPTRTLSVTIPIAIASGTPPSAPCDPEAFSVDAGCCDAGHAPSSIVLAVIVSLRWRKRGSSAARAGTRSRTA